MKKEWPLILGLALLLVSTVILAKINTDACYVDAGVLFFVICIAYATWCENL